MLWNNLLRCCWIDNTMETWKIIKKKRAKNSFLNQCMNRQKGLDKWTSTQHIKWCGYTTTRKILDYTDILISCIWISIYLLRGAMNVGSWKDVEIYKRLHFMHLLDELLWWMSSPLLFTVSGQFCTFVG